MEYLYSFLRIAVIVAVVIGFILRLFKNSGVGFDGKTSVKNNPGIIDYSLIVLFILLAFYALYDQIIVN